jgi:hypothetical protein
MFLSAIEMVGTIEPVLDLVHVVPDRLDDIIFLFFVVGDHSS